MLIHPVHRDTNIVNTSSKDIYISRLKFRTLCCSFCCSGLGGLPDFFGPVDGTRQQRFKFTHSKDLIKIDRLDKIDKID